MRVANYSCLATMYFVGQLYLSVKAQIDLSLLDVIVKPHFLRCILIHTVHDFRVKFEIICNAFFAGCSRECVFVCVCFVRVTAYRVIASHDSVAAYTFGCRPLNVLHERLFNQFAYRSPSGETCKEVIKNKTPH